MDTQKHKIIAAALALAVETPWSEMTMAQIAARAGVQLADMENAFTCKDDILAAHAKSVDAKVLAAFPGGASGDVPRDRLFDVIMERFDVLNEDREGIIAILKNLRCDPKEALIAVPYLGRSMAWMLEAAKIPATGWRGAARVAGLAAVYLATIRTWMKDDSADMPKTMAALDKHLKKAEKIASSFGF